MTLILPDFYQGGFLDAELLMMDLLRPFTDMVTDDETGRHPTLCTSLPKRYNDHLPIIRVFRIGGPPDLTSNVDPAVVQLGVIAGRSSTMTPRADSWALMGLCIQMIGTYVEGGTVVRADGSKSLVDTTGIQAGPQQIPELNPDNRLVPVSFVLQTRKPRGVPDYLADRERIVQSLL